MSIVVVGINHKKAPLGVREKFSFGPNTIADNYRSLAKYPEIKETLILSTCNRVELYGAGAQAGIVADSLKRFLYDTHGMAPDFHEEYFYVKTGRDCMEHLLKVASGLDSMVIGEHEIMSQIKKAYDQACAAGVIGKRLHGAIQDSLRVAKKVRSSTNISKGVTSISGAVVELIRKEQCLESKKVVVVGAGKIGSLTVAKLSGLRLGNITVTNRDIAKAEELKKGSSVRVVDIRTLDEEILSADIVIAATAAPTHLLHRKMVESALRARDKELLLVDLGVPRNIDETVRDIGNVRLYNIDDLEPIIEETIRARSVEAGKALDMIKAEPVCAR